MGSFFGKGHLELSGAITLWLCLLLCLSWITCPLAWGQDEKTSTQDLESLVQTIEDPDKRKALLDQLRSLVEAQKALEAGKDAGESRDSAEAQLVLLSESLFTRFENLLERIVDSARETALMLKRIPEGLAWAKRHLSMTDARQSLFRLAGVALAALLVALILRLLLRRRLPRPRAPEAAWPSRLIASGGTWALKVLPWGLSLLALFLFFRAVPHPGVGRPLVLHLFTVLFGYRIVVEGMRSLLSPEEPGLRMLGLSDESAYYYWLWMRRFANYTALYFLLVGPLSLFQVPESAYLFIRGLLLLVFPGMITAFVLQISRDLRLRQEPSSITAPDEETRSGKRLKRLSVRVLPILAVVYVWAFFLVLMGSREEGFEFLFGATLGTAITIPAVIAALHLLDWLFDKLFAVHERIKARVPGIEERADRYLEVVRKVSAVVLILIGAGVVAEFWGVPVSDFVVSKVGSVILTRVVAIAVTLGVVVTILQLNRVASVYLLRETAGRTVTQKTKTLVPMIRAAAGIAVLFVGGIVILSQIGVDTTPILAGAGIVGLAVGFGSQTLVKDLINGLFILFEESIRVGDWAQLGNKDGEVEAVGLRTVRLRDLSGNVHVIPNSSIDTLTNYSKEFARSLVDIGVAYRENVDEVIAVMQEVADGMQKDDAFGRDILGPITILGLDRFDDSAVVIRAFFTTRPLTQWRIRREFHRRLKQVFDERGIEIPFPHRTVYMGEPKQGNAPPVHVQMDDTPHGDEAQEAPPALPVSGDTSHPKEE